MGWHLEKVREEQDVGWAPLASQAADLGMTFELEKGRSFENTEHCPSGREVDVTEIGGLRKLEAFPVFFPWTLFPEVAEPSFVLLAPHKPPN